ncbi:MAG: ATP-binding protein [Prevotellaceae bacterium]|jgi:hypothetical protein|nr:ATP-binding protein [Prevotellaceae bacterium]
MYLSLIEKIKGFFKTRQRTDGSRRVLTKLPLGIQSFEDIRDKKYLYVDKTEIIHRIVSKGKVYFLSRPRRFGKSLLINTLEELFKGNRKLFKGLYIYDKWKWSQKYPVIKIDWGGINHSTPEEMKESLISYLKEIAEKYQITLNEKSAIDSFRKLIESLHSKTGKKTVILIDEYDKPITSHLFDTDLNDIKKAIHDFYQVMKSSDNHIEFIFITGVSKFSGLSIFSALNNPVDITIDEDYVSICGYTQEELESNFSEYIDSAAEHLKMTREDLLEQIRYWYNGYTWDGKTAVYNPVSTMIFLDTREFVGYWFRTGTPTFLIDIIQRRNRPDIVLTQHVVSNNAFNGYDPPKINEISLFFQTGYLTVKQKDVIGGIPSYTLDIPNMEVKEALLKCLLEAYGQYSDEQVINLRKTMQQQILACDEPGFSRTLESMVASIPPELHIGSESYYHSIMLMWMRIIGFEIQAEASNNLGRADIVWKQPEPEVTVVAEIKYHATVKIESLLNDAVNQINNRRYYNKYHGKIILLGIAFSGKNVGCRLEELKIVDNIYLDK